MSGITATKKLVTPRGVAEWPRLNEPSTKFDPDGVYECKLVFDEDTDGLEKLQKAIDTMLEAEYQAQVKKATEDGKAALAKKIGKADSPLKPQEDNDTGEETGKLVLKGKKKASGISKKTGKKWSSRPDFFNAKGVKLKNPPKIGGGSVLKMSVELAPYFNAKDKEVGVSVRMEGIQILKVMAFGERDAADHGFGAEEGDDIDELLDAPFDADDSDDTGGAPSNSDDDDDEDF